MADGMQIYLDPKDVLRVELAFKTMSDLDKTQIIRKAINKATSKLNTYTRQSINRTLQKRTGNLLGSLMKTYVKKRRSGYAAFRRPHNPKNLPKGKQGGYHAHLLEFGTKKRKTKSGANRGYVRPYMYKTNVINTKGNEILTIVLNNIHEGINKIIK